MIQWLALTDAQRRTSLEQAQINSGIIPEAIEKDGWVTLVLKRCLNYPMQTILFLKVALR